MYMGSVVFVLGASDRGHSGSRLIGSRFISLPLIAVAFLHPFLTLLDFVSHIPMDVIEAGVMMVCPTETDGRFAIDGSSANYPNET